jgi:hypothetical protein
LRHAAQYDRRLYTEVPLRCVEESYQQGVVALIHGSVMLVVRLNSKGASENPRS